MPFFPSLKWGKGGLNFSFQLTKIVAYEVKYTKTRSYLGGWLFVQTRHPHYAVIDDSLAAHTEVPTHLPLATQVVNLKFTDYLNVFTRHGRCYHKFNKNKFDFL